MSIFEPRAWRWNPAPARGYIGWRLWRATRDGRLLPLTTDHPWEPGMNVAVCITGSEPVPRKPCEEVPGWDHQCGFWAMRERAAMEAFRDRNWSMALPHYAPVWGQVALWGNVVVSEHGWRASHARPVAIAARPGWTECLAQRGFVVVPEAEIV